MENNKETINLTNESIDNLNLFDTYDKEADRLEKIDFAIKHDLDLSKIDLNDDQSFWDYAWEEDEKKTHRR